VKALEEVEEECSSQRLVYRVKALGSEREERGSVSENWR
jgi:hypothetical protein